MNATNKIFRLIEYMNSHVCDNLSLDEMCRVVDLSKSHMGALFSLYIGETPNKYFYNLKLKYGSRLLYSDDNVLDVALKIGFNSHEAFARAFKKEFGLTPSEYKSMYKKGLHPLEELNDIELTFIFEPSPAYRLFLGLDKFGDNYGIYQSLINKGYIGAESFECTAEGMQLRDMYLWDCSKLIIELSKEYNTLSALHENTEKIIHIPKILFYRFVHGLVEVGKIKNVFLGCCGSNCFTCKTLKATLDDDDDLRKEQATSLLKDFNIEVDYKEFNCLGCTSDNRSESCIAHCPWVPCCKSHTVTRCNLCEEFSCNDLKELFSHLPEFEENFSKYK